MRSHALTYSHGRADGCSTSNLTLTGIRILINYIPVTQVIMARTPEQGAMPGVQNAGSEFNGPYSVRYVRYMLSAVRLLSVCCL